ncbi:twin-arginine translocation signal domain-containing protein, partial [Streptomyces sp. NPDC041003]|uniref:twin-arginine translocation signal domain-containing protein n=1 Tax=Streptomyces sp. NPDC041003 TaxID=3155730 RepID=UPI0033C9F379
MPTRRHFLAGSAAALGLGALPAAPEAGPPGPPRLRRLPLRGGQSHLWDLDAQVEERELAALTEEIDRTTLFAAAR